MDVVFFVPFPVFTVTHVITIQFLMGLGLISLTIYKALYYYSVLEAHL